MINEALFFVTLLVNFTGIILAYKLFGRLGIYCWIGLATVIANIEVVKSVDLFGMVATLGNIVYGTTFLATDILSEKYGGKAARKGVFIGLFSMIAFTILIQIDLLYVPNADDIANESMQTLFSLLPRICVASIMAYFASNMLDTYIYEFIKNKCHNGRHLWLRNNGSTLISQSIDSLVFCLVSFWGVYPTNVVIELCLTTYLFKLIIAICDTPFLYIAKRIRNNPADDQIANRIISLE